MLMKNRIDRLVELFKKFLALTFSTIYIYIYIYLYIYIYIQQKKYIYTKSIWNTEAKSGQA